MKSIRNNIIISVILALVLLAALSWNFVVANNEENIYNDYSDVFTGSSNTEFDDLLSTQDMIAEELQEAYLSFIEDFFFGGSLASFFGDNGFTFDNFRSAARHDGLYIELLHDDIVIKNHDDMHFSVFSEPEHSHRAIHDMESRSIRFIENAQRSAATAILTIYIPYSWNMQRIYVASSGNIDIADSITAEEITIN